MLVVVAHFANHGRGSQSPAKKATTKKKLDGQPREIKFRLKSISQEMLALEYASLILKICV